MTTRYVDLAYVRGDEGIYDLAIDDETEDLKVTDGLESAYFVSLFSDRRAYSTEVADPLNRRGWIGDMTADVPGDLFGSAIWLFEQRRGTSEVAAQLRMAAVESLQWMFDLELVNDIRGQVLVQPGTRSVNLVISVEHLDGGVSKRAFELAEATRTGELVRL